MFKLDEFIIQNTASASSQPKNAIKSHWFYEDRIFFELYVTICFNLMVGTIEWIEFLPFGYGWIWKQKTLPKILYFFASLHV